MSQVTRSEKWAPGQNTIPSFLHIFLEDIKWQEILSRSTSVFPPETSQGLTALMFHILPSIEQNLTELEK